MLNLLCVCLGGALGSGARFLVGMWAASTLDTRFPAGTLIVNLVGSFLLAVIAGVSLKSGAISPTVRLFLTTGIMGGFTTYSSFNYETLRLFNEGSRGLAALNVVVTLVGCLLVGLLGTAAASRLTG